jgi:hypothetical protein
VSYPLDWTLSIPSKGVQLQVDPVIRASEFDARTTTLNVYWEGAIKLSGSHSGVGFMELSGYEAAKDAAAGTASARSARSSKAINRTDPTRQAQALPSSRRTNSALVVDPQLAKAMGNMIAYRCWRKRQAAGNCRIGLPRRIARGDLTLARRKLPQYAIQDAG